ncbi:MAG: hypothetical protein JXA82_12115 [Sedimentisphaerales bacterium]|nr:hypothetical protein [Sedimentisphaerales bacterium]
MATVRFRKRSYERPSVRTRSARNIELPTLLSVSTRPNRRAAWTDKNQVYRPARNSVMLPIVLTNVLYEQQP